MDSIVMSSNVLVPMYNGEALTGLKYEKLRNDLCDHASAFVDDSDRLREIFRMHGVEPDEIYYGVPDKKKRLRCGYCGCISEKDYGNCTHCGAPLVEQEDIEMRMADIKAAEPIVRYR